jgi:hypothetical protein
MARRKGVPEAPTSGSGLSLVPSPIQPSSDQSLAGGPSQTAAGVSPKLELVVDNTKAKPSRADIDRLGKVQQILGDYKLQIEPFELEADVLERKILAGCEDLDATAIHTDEGDGFRLRVSAKAEKQQIKPGGLAKVLAWIGQETFLLIARPTFEGLKGVLSEAQYEEVVRKEKNGKRSVKCVAKAAPEPLKVA